MDEDRHLRRVGRLRDRVALSFAVEDALIEELSQRAARLRRGGHERAAREAEQAVRRHRVGILKHRALLAAGGLEV